jgi:hypothetical protein
MHELLDLSTPNLSALLSKPTMAGNMGNMATLLLPTLLIAAQFD